MGLIAMKAQDEAARKSVQGSLQSPTTSSILTRALLASVAVVGIIGVSLHLGSGGGSWPLQTSGDSVSTANAEVRAEQFAMLAPLPLSLVTDSESVIALDSMQLDPSTKAALAAALLTSPSTVHSAPDTPSAPNAATKPAADSSAVRLAWVTLWDTDAEDGDVVRLDSEGYSRTVTLAKQPMRFAVPVPRDGVIKVTGIRDGEGGGITVGLASGASQAVFPIMSVGQTLGLKVSFDP
jgi:hypothetical protein